MTWRAGPGGVIALNGDLDPLTLPLGEKENCRRGRCPHTSTRQRCVPIWTSQGYPVGQCLRQPRAIPGAGGSSCAHEPGRLLERLKGIVTVAADHDRSVAPTWAPSANGSGRYEMAHRLRAE
jgi:hypothetical protein